MPKPTKDKDPLAVQIGQRIKQAREMGGFTTQAKLNQGLIQKYAWSSGRLGNYESGYSIPHPGDIQILAAETGTSACWIMFGSGPIRSRERDIQAIRHQNLIYCIENLQSNKAKYSKFLASVGLNQKTLALLLENPFRKISSRLSRQIEASLEKRKGWFDEQHVENDPLCSKFPDDLRELMTIYSELDEEGRALLLKLANVVSKS